MTNPLSLQGSLRRITASLTMYNFASGLIGVFIPLIILKSGGPLWKVALFYMVYAVIKLAINYPTVMLIQRKGPNVGLGIAFVAGAVQMLSILAFVGSKQEFFLIMGAASLSLTNAFLWSSQHLFISRVMDDDTKSSSIATIAIVNQLTNVAAPLAGGFIGEYAGSGYLLSLSLLFYAMALIPLKGMNLPAETALNQRIAYSLKGAPARDVMANYFYSIETSVGSFVWPIYLAVFVATYKSVGLITAIAAAVTVMTTWVAGHRGDKGKDRMVLKEGAATNSFVDLVRIFATSQFWIAVVSSGYQASLSYLQNAWASTYYHHAKKHGLQYIMSMEIANDLAYVTLWGVLLAVLAVGTEHAFFLAAFVIAAAAAWGCLLITKQAR